MLSAFSLILYMVQIKQDSTLTAACLPGALKISSQATKFRILSAQSGNEISV